MICPNCKNLKTEFFFEALNVHGTQKLSEEKFIILKCQNCGLIFPQFIPGKDFYRKYYPQNYYAENNFPFRFILVIYQTICSFWSRFLISRFLKRGKILDFGCGQGQFLDSLPKNFEKYGVEVNSKAIKFIKKNSPQIKIFNSLSSLKKKSLKFNLITLWHVIEHLDNPRSILRQLAGFLEKDDLMMFSTPNSQSFGLRVARVHWFHLDVPIHLMIFNPNNLTKLCEDAGLKVIKVRGNWLEYPLDLFHSVFNRFKTRNSILNFLLILFIVPASLAVKFFCLLFWLEKSETITLICKKR